MKNETSKRNFYRVYHFIIDRYLYVNFDTFYYNLIKRLLHFFQRLTLSVRNSWPRYRLSYVGEYDARFFFRTWRIPRPRRQQMYARQNPRRLHPRRACNSFGSHPSPSHGAPAPWVECKPHARASTVVVALHAHVMPR